MRFYSRSVRKGHQVAKAFTLVELLFVVTLLILMVSVAGVGVPAALASQRLSSAARQLSADLNKVALVARKENRVVELRFYLMDSVLNPGQAMAYRAYQTGLVAGWDGDGNPETQFATDVVLLPEDVVIMPDEKYNTLHQLELMKNEDPNRADGSSYVSYFIQSNGSTSLPQDKPAVMTLVREKGGDIPTILPTDYRSVVINPQTHQTRVY